MLQKKRRSGRTFAVGDRTRPPAACSLRCWKTGQSAELAPSGPLDRPTPSELAANTHDIGWIQRACEPGASAVSLCQVGSSTTCCFQEA